MVVLSLEIVKETVSFPSTTIYLHKSVRISYWYLKILQWSYETIVDAIKDIKDRANKIFK